MLNFQNKLLFIPAIAALSLSSCSDKADDPKKNEENELITSIHVHLKKAGGTITTMATWKDLTPDDASGRTIDTLFLEASTLYTGEIELKDESKSPSIDISAEVKTEATDHLFVYKQTPAAPVFFTVVRTDKDSKNLEIGLEYTLQTMAQKGITGLNIILRHQPGSKDGSETPGDSDVDVVIPVVVR